MTDKSRSQEFSREFPMAELGDAPVEQVFEASDEEREALRERFGIETLGAVCAELAVTPLSEGSVRVAGKVFASLGQLCVVTLEPVAETIEEEFSVTFLREGPEAEELAEKSALDEEEVDTYDGETLDLGELVTQQVAAAINPYPRKDGAEFGKPDALSDNADGVRENPFAVLRGLGARGGNADEG